MLYSYAQGKGLRFDKHLSAVQQLKNITCGVASGQDHSHALDRITILGDYPFDFIFLQDQFIKKKP
jgi:hypothetical protein